MQAVVLFGAAACNDKETPRPEADAAVATPSDAQDASGGGAAAPRAALLGAVAACVRETTAQFLERARGLDAAVAGLASTPDEARREAAREAFRAAMDTWQVAEVMQIGPAARSVLPGGQNLRDEIYFWPLDDACAVEKELVARGWESPAFAKSLANRRGLGALEALLFDDGAASRCATPTEGWAALSAEERDARRRAYAAAASADLLARARALAEAWDPAAGNFTATLATPGNAVFPNVEAALNAVTAALYYVDTQVKDTKVALPLGPDCGAPSCAHLVESRFARRSKANVAANLEGFRRLVFGCGPGGAGFGFDDLLEAVGAGATASRLRAASDGVAAAIAAIEEPDLGAAIAADAASVGELYRAWKGVTDLLKSELLTALDLEAPAHLPTDND